MPAPDNEFDRIMDQEFPEKNPTEYTDHNPYGGPTTHAQKPGLTKRGKVALGIGATVIAGGGLIGYQIHTTNEVKAQEISLKSQTLEIQKMREINRIRETGKKEQNAQAKARQTSIDTCVKGQSDQVGKGFGSPSYRDVVDACQAQYAGTVSTDDMEAAGASQTATDGTEGGVNQGLLIGGAALVLFLVVAAKRGTRSNAA